MARRLRCIDAPGFLPPGWASDCEGEVQMRPPVAEAKRGLPRCDEHWKLRSERAAEDRVDRR